MAVIGCDAAIAVCVCVCVCPPPPLHFALLSNKPDLSCETMTGHVRFRHFAVDVVEGLGERMRGLRSGKPEFWRHDFLWKQ